MTITVNVRDHEWYPVWWIEDDFPDIEIQLTQSEIDRVKAAFTEFQDIQNMLAKKVKEHGKYVGEGAEIEKDHQDADT